MQEKENFKNPEIDLIRNHVQLAITCLERLLEGKTIPQETIKMAEEGLKNALNLAKNTPYLNVTSNKVVEHIDRINLTFYMLETEIPDEITLNDTLYSLEFLLKLTERITN